MPDTRTKALNYLRSGAVIILHARTPADQRAPIEVVAIVRGFTGRHTVELRTDGKWLCSCTPVVMDEGSECAHRAAVALTTGHPTIAAKPAKARRAA